MLCLLPIDSYGQEEMYWRIWLIRKGTMLFCTLLLGFHAYKYQDYNKINNTLLVQIQRQNLELKSYLETIGIRTKRLLRARLLYLTILLLTGKGGLPSMKFMPPDVIDALDKRQRENEDSSDSEFSYDSEASDGTYVPSSCDEDTFETAHSRQSSCVPSPAVLLPVLPHLSVIKKEEKLERPSSRASQSRANTPAPVTSPYNLRSRSNSRLTLNSSISNESPEAFGQKVKQMERIARRNATLIASAHKVTPSYYSSDDE